MPTLKPISSPVSDAMGRGRPSGDGRGRAAKRPIGTRMMSAEQSASASSRDRPRDGDEDCHDDDDDGDDRFSQAPAPAAKEAASATRGAPPLSIASAMRRGNEGKGDGTSGGGGGGGGATTCDVVAVILSSAIQEPTVPLAVDSKAPTSTKFTRGGGRRRLRVLLGDHTLPRGRCARASWTIDPSRCRAAAENDASHPTTAGRMGGLQPGDVVRWNGVRVWRDYSEEGEASADAMASGDGRKRKLSTNDDSGEGDDAAEDNARDNHSPLLSVICDLSMSWKELEAGPPMVRLCRITPTQSTRNSNAEHRQKQSNYNLEWETAIPPSMATATQVVTTLADWYCENAAHHHAKSTAVLPLHQPCERRRLREVTMPNMLSHLVARVLRCERATSHYSPLRKITKDSVLTHVTLSDGAGSDDLLGMVGSGRTVAGCTPPIPKAIAQALLQSMNEGSHVLITHVLSQHASPNAGGGGALGRESIVLTATRETVATVLTADHPYYPPSERSNRLSGGDDPFASQPLTAERASQLYSLTQQHSPPAAGEAAALQRRGMMAVVAPLADIIVDGVDTSFLEGSHWENAFKLSRFLIDSPSLCTGLNAVPLRPSYRSATLVLEPSKVSRDITVNADGNAMKLLCMDVPVQDMVLTSVTARHSYLGRVGDVLKALCSDDAPPIRWILEQESPSSWFVTNATLLEI